MGALRRLALTSAGSLRRIEPRGRALARHGDVHGAPAAAEPGAGGAAAGGRRAPGGRADADAAPHLQTAAKPLARRALAHPREWLSRWRHFIWLGGLGVGFYNAMQYLALHTASPVNVTLIGASVPVWMMLVGLVAYGQVLLLRQLLGAVLSIGGVMLVMSQGQWSTFEHWRWVPGDLYMLAASLAWAIYSWMLARPPASLVGPERPLWTWADFLWVQIVFGLLWGLAGTTLEHTLTDQAMGWDWLRDPKAWAALRACSSAPRLNRSSASSSRLPRLPM